VCVDALSRFTWLFPTKSTSTKEVIDCLDLIKNTFGKPIEIVSDRGTAFTSKEFANYTLQNRIKHRKVAVAAPWANGIVEHVNRFIKSSFTKLLNIQTDWKNQLGNLQYIINNTYHSVVKASPAKVLLGIDQRNHEDNFIVRFTQILANIDTDLEKERITYRDTATQATNVIRQYNKLYRVHNKKPTMYKEGDYVLIKNDRGKVGTSSKLKANYKGPYLIYSKEPR